MRLRRGGLRCHSAAIGTDNISKGGSRMIPIPYLVLVCISSIITGGGASVVIVMPNNASMLFPDTEAIFAPPVPGAGALGVLYAASPSDACQPLRNGPVLLQPPILSFVIVARGLCPFDTKVREAQSAGFNGIIVHNDKDKRELLTMSGKSKGIQILAVFVSKDTGEVLLKYAGDVSVKCYILPVFESATWSIMAVSFISLLAVTAVLSTFFFVRRQRIQGLGSRLLFSRSPLNMSFRAVKSLPSLLFKLGVSDTATSETCAICLEDYETGDKLRILPCRHEYHSACIDRWLLLRQSFCPKCKRDVRVEAEAMVASETTPLLASVPRFPFTIVSSRHIPIGITDAGSFQRGSSDALNFSGTTRMPPVGSFASSSNSSATSYSSSVVVPISLSTYSFHSHSAYSVSCTHQDDSLMSNARSYSSS